jgi:hypothetical protein
VSSPADVEIDAATRDGSLGTLSFAASQLNVGFSVLNTVVNGIHQFPNSATRGEGPASGEEVQITITFTKPIRSPGIPASGIVSPFRENVILNGAGACAARVASKRRSFMKDSTG